jgi:hypothetical protein
MKHNKTQLEVAALILAAATSLAVANPDVIVGDLPDFDSYPPFNGISAFAVGTTSCNIGTSNLSWIASNNRHPVIAQNLYRWKMVNGAGRFEQLGSSHLKHGFTALNGNLCDSCLTNDGTGDTLDPTCSDPYSAGLNGSQGRLGPRSQVNAYTGFYPYPFAGQGTAIPSDANGGQIWRRLQVRTTEVQPSGNTGAVYFAEGHYIASDDAAAGNSLNNAAYRRVTITGVPGNLTMAAAAGYPTQRRLPAIYGWQTAESGVTIRSVTVPGEGTFDIGYKVTTLPAGAGYHYEYVVHNMNSDRSGAFFQLNFPTSGLNEFTSIYNVGFRDVDSHSGEPHSNTDWVATRTNEYQRWSVPQTFAQNANANALRWTTSFTFRFDSDRAPVAGTGTLGLFKPGTPTEITIPGLMVPSSVPCIADFNTDGGVDGTDVQDFFTVFATGEVGADTNRDGGVDGSDVETFFVHWAQGC